MVWTSNDIRYGVRTNHWSLGNKILFISLPISSMYSISFDCIHTWIWCKNSNSTKHIKKTISFYEKTVLPIAIVTFFLSFTFGGITTFLPLFAANIEVNTGTFS